MHTGTTCLRATCEVPGEWLDATLYDWDDGAGEGERVLSVEAVDGGAARELHQ